MRVLGEGFGLGLPNPKPSICRLSLSTAWPNTAEFWMSETTPIPKLAKARNKTGHTAQGGGVGEQGRSLCVTLHYLSPNYCICSPCFTEDKGVIACRVRFSVAVGLTSSRPAVLIHAGKFSWWFDDLKLLMNPHCVFSDWESLLQS